MKLSLIARLALFLFFITMTTGYADDTFRYSYTNPRSVDKKYITEHNVELTDEGSVTYWKPIVGGPTKDFATRGEIIYHFPFNENTIRSAYLSMYTASYHWSYSQGHTYLYASSDGSYWTKLAEAPPPQIGYANYAHFKGLLLEDVLQHKSNIYLKAVLYSYGPRAYLGGAYTNTAQHSRYQHGSDIPVFVLDVVFDKWIRGIIEIKTNYNDIDGEEITTDRLVPGKASTIKLDIENFRKNPINARVTIGISMTTSSGTTLKTIGQSDHVLAPGVRTPTTTKVTIPSDFPANKALLYIVLGDNTSKEILDTYREDWVVAKDEMLILGSMILLLLN